MKIEYSKDLIAMEVVDAAKSVIEDIENLKNDTDRIIDYLSYKELKYWLSAWDKKEIIHVCSGDTLNVRNVQDKTEYFEIFSDKEVGLILRGNRLFIKLTPGVKFKIVGSVITDD